MTEIAKSKMTSNRRTRRVLIAEDHDEFRELLAQSFRHHGYEVTECRHGIDLVEQLRCLQDPARDSDYDLVISDIRMPGVTGLSILDGLRECKNAPPVILITAFGDPQTHAEAKRLGAAAIIDKPFEILDLLVKARAVMR
jgi:DNA-binding response OmpR family regulator